MPPAKPDPLDRTSGFGPNRHRMEIELMEKRFRERSERRAGTPPSTGEIEGRVSDEMRQFFDASAQQLEAVVPRLQEGQSAQGMIETTGEIKKKIDEFFSEGAKAPVAAATAPPPRASRAAPPPVRSAAPAAARSTVPPQQRSRPAAPPPAAAAPDADAPAPMDLKSALEKLRRHGVAKGNDSIGRAVAARSSAPAMRAAVPAPPPPVARRDPPPAPPPPPPPAPVQQQRGAAPTVMDDRVSAPAPRGSLEMPPQPSQSPASTPRPISQPRPISSPRQAEPARQAEPPRPVPQAPARATIAPGASALPPRPKPKAPGEKPRQISELPAISTDEVSLVSNPEPTIRRSQRPSQVLPGGASAPTAAESSAADVKFDAIFDEVQGIVMDTLKASVNETFDAARAAEPDLAQVAVPTLGEPVAAPVSEAVPAPAAPPSARKTRLPRPEEDEEEEKDEPAPAAPHDWGVKRAAKPKGAWLLDAQEQPAKPEPSPQTVTGDLPDLPRAAEPPAGGGGGGARSYLLRKAGDEVKRFQPVLKALQQKKLVDVEKPAVQASGSDDEFVSADSFKDSRPTPAELEEELSPMRLVEELRRLKRVSQALVAKGIISAEDLAKAADD